MVLFESISLPLATKVKVVFGRATHRINRPASRDLHHNASGRDSRSCDLLLRIQKRRIQLDSSRGSKAEESWWKSAMAIQQVVPNTGSIARDILAAERTFLAWSRTGLGFVGAGSALFAAYHQSSGKGAENEAKEARVASTVIPTNMEKPYLEQDKFMDLGILNLNLNLHLYPTLAAALLVGNGVFLLAFATRRYLRTVVLMTRQMDIPLFPIDTRGTLIAVAVTASSTFVSLGLVFSTATQDWTIRKQNAEN